ncbi:fumarylacetoacetate hydrolase family protein [Acinetobacter gerneri]|uniref:Fumarylacetoacetate hydrolase family protein n=1 Tax=Acinetobacter gerneri TaxID=202952 RepID=A0AAW8JP93_9GAMM|nr:fumarylacetoacetate hydrolase family protein [Acinetobacter gerneri]MDQ9011612.1 fumarylacetoacetate hydrolase family protein [Acinetobacter gerneri]MDQ9015746.1 fumarylacetoacetate hydrolase family protein [Acinetobacter gerneri]MDQ9026917.1 fumarylacetoacetate hydrolase family protein [Acinetobacter gerneri]MDQ9054200.1 fumarylacetoacetate hydrolase family protein [Acinetobacter gerneri]MDQ9061863.1 fumarylacetoacetate hydrolase family protein [Acinetobacter gerneri]
MKLATLKNGKRDGQLVIVSRDLSQAVVVNDIALTLQEALEDWDRVEPLLKQKYNALNKKNVSEAFDFDQTKAMSPLPRSYQWADASSFLNHGKLMEQAFNLDIKKDENVPIIYQGSGDDFFAPYDDYPVPGEEHLIDFEGEVAVILDDVPMGVKAEQAGKHIKLLMLLNDVSLRAHLFKEVSIGFGPLRAKPSTVFAPVAVTPDELGESWENGRVKLDLHVECNEKVFGHPNGAEMDFSFPELIMHLARTRNLKTGTILGSGTFSNQNYKEVGSACLAEKRAIEILETGEAKTEFLKFGDQLKFEMFDLSGQSIFGAIKHKFVAAEAP